MPITSWRGSLIARSCAAEDCHHFTSARTSRWYSRAMTSLALVQGPVRASVRKFVLCENLSSATWRSDSVCTTWERVAEYLTGFTPRDCR